MIVDERVRDYIHSLEPEQGSLEEEIAREAEAGRSEEHTSELQSH